MTRYTPIYASIWEDDDFILLPASAQRLYQLLITQKNISHCGALPLSVRRWARLAPDTDADSVRADLDVLQRATFIYVDEDTEEVLARSYMKHARFFLVPNGRKACTKAIEALVSSHLRTLAGTLLGTLTETVSETDGPPIAACSTAHLNQQPAAADESRSDSTPPAVDNAAAFEEAVDLAVEHRRQHTANITNPPRWTQTTRAGIITDHGQRIRELLAAGHTSEQVIEAIYGRKPTAPPRRDLDAENARSCAASHRATGSAPADAYAAAIASYPRQHEAICTELAWSPPGPEATVHPIHPAGLSDARPFPTAASQNGANP